MSDKPGCLSTLDYAKRWGVEPMCSDFKSRGSGIEDTQIQHPDRLARLLLVTAPALCCAVSTGQWDAKHHPVPAEKTLEPATQDGRALQDVLWFTRGLRHIAELLQAALPSPQLWSTQLMDGEV